MYRIVYSSQARKDAKKTVAPRRMDVMYSMHIEIIVVSGFVDSVEREIRNAAVAVAPVRIAAGIQNKGLISMACGIPVVLTSLIAAAVVSLIQDSGRRNAIARNGYELMKRAYSWNERLEGYEL